MITKDCEVEVCSEEEGFEGAWFRAVLRENPTISGRKKLRVEYMTMLSDDGVSPLFESFEQQFIRPVPSETLYDGVVLEEGSVVDADHNDLWWTGVVLKKENDSFLVYFDSPPDVIKFERKQLRPHLEWTGWKWNRPEKKVLDKSMFCSGTMVEIRSLVAETAWFPAMIVKEIEEDGDEKKFIVKDWFKYLSSNGDEATQNTTVGFHRVRPTPPPSSAGEYKLFDSVEAFDGSLWHQGLVRRVLTNESYMVRLESTNMEHVFKRSDLRPLKVWEDGAWRNKTPEKTQSSHDGLGNDSTQQKASGGLGKETDDVVMNNQTPPVITLQVTSLVEGSLSTVTPTPVITETMELEPHKRKSVSCINQYKSRKRKRDENHNTSLEHSGMSKSPASYIILVNRNLGTSGNIRNDGDVVDQTISSWTGNISNELNYDDEFVACVGKNALVDLPFAKKSPYWEVCELTEEFKSVPQQPHFIPLLVEKDSIREWTAIGMMVTFYGLLEKVKNLKLHDSMIKLNELSLSFAKLEKNGFDVVAPQLRIDKVKSLKDMRAKKAEEMRCFENKIDEGEKESCMLEEEKANLKLKILELQRQEVVMKEKEDAVKKGIAEMKSSVNMIHKEIEDGEFEFQKTISAPWN
ncbi:unnamed protein product [Cochlearia groenlandica]